MAIHRAIIAAVAALAGCAAPQTQTAPSVEPQIAWLEDHLGRALDYPRPEVAIMSQAMLQLHGGGLSANGTVIDGIYNYRTGVIGIRDARDGDVIAHELVHWQQHMEGQPQCEAEAYAVQLAYAQQHGSPRDLGYMQRQAEKGC